VIFVDTNVFMYAVGRAHPLKQEARDFFASDVVAGARLVTSAEVLQELLHAYVPVGRLDTLDAALALINGCVARIWPVEPEDVFLARLLIGSHPGLAVRDLVHLACCRRHEVADVKTFDRTLAAAFGNG